VFTKYIFVQDLIHLFLKKQEGA